MQVEYFPLIAFETVTFQDHNSSVTIPHEDVVLNNVRWMIFIWRSIIVFVCVEEIENPSLWDCFPQLAQVYARVLHPLRLFYDFRGAWFHVINFQCLLGWQPWKSIRCSCLVGSRQGCLSAVHALPSVIFESHAPRRSKRCDRPNKIWTRIWKLTFYHIVKDNSELSAYDTSFTRFRSKLTVLSAQQWQKLKCARLRRRINTISTAKR